jgi:ketopantoate reductase
MTSKARILLVGSGGIGTIAALNLECGQMAEVSSVLHSNYATVVKNGFEIISCEHGHLKGWRPTESILQFFMTRVLPTPSAQR